MDFQVQYTLLSFQTFVTLLQLLGRWARRWMRDAPRTGCTLRITLICICLLEIIAKHRGETLVASNSAYTPVSSLSCLAFFGGFGTKNF